MTSRIRQKIAERHRRLKAQYRELYDATAALLFRHDPAGINFESNTDEYELEAGTILPRLRGCQCEADVRRVVHEEFVRWFGPEHAGPQDRYAQIAAEVWQLSEKQRALTGSPNLAARPVTAEPQDRYWLVARDESELLTQMMHFLAGDARISFEGDLSRCDFPSSIPRVTEEDAVLSRATHSPQLDFVILPLEHETVKPILDAVLPAKRYVRDIIHIQIEKHRQLQFGSYDQFHDGCIVCYLGVPTEFLDELKQKGILESWTTPHEDAGRWHG